jgi:hypothetical protein
MALEFNLARHEFTMRCLPRLPCPVPICAYLTALAYITSAWLISYEGTVNAPFVEENNSEVTWGDYLVVRTLSGGDLMFADSLNRALNCAMLFR